MRRQGIEILLNTDVREIMVSKDDSNRVTGVITQDAKQISADRVICNGDPPTIYAEMLPAHKGKRKKALPDKVTRYSMGLYVLFFGTKKNLS
jgi:phytoene desaturase